MPRGSGVFIDGKSYNLVQDHETYVVEDVPSHPDTDARMERRVKFDSWKKGILRRRRDAGQDDNTIYTISYANRTEKVGDGIWFSWGGDTRMTDRIFAQRAVGSSQSIASAPIAMGDASAYSYVATAQHLYSISGVVGGVQQLVLSKDFSGIVPAVNITDVAAYNGRLYVATAQLTNGLPDPAKPQIIWVWDQTSSTTNWTNPPTALATPTWLAGVQTTLTTAIAASGVSTITVGSTTGMPGAGNFTVQIDNELLTVSFNSSTVLNVVARGVNGTSAVAHAAVVAVIYNPSVANAGTAGTTRYQYTITATGTANDSLPSLTQTITTGNATLNGTNYNVLSWNAVGGATGYKVSRTYSGGTPNTTGIIATGVAGTTYNDQGAAPTSLQYQVTPQFALGDTGKAIAFVVIRNILWRAAGAKMWSWDGQQGTWSGESVIGDPSTNITGLDSYKDGLIVFKTDGIFTMDHTGTVFPLFPGFKSLGMNPRPLGQWQGSYYFASDVGMVWEWDGSTVTSIGFDSAEAYPFPDGTYGLPNAVTQGMSLPNFLLVGFNKWNDTTHNACFFFAWDGTGWHPFHFDQNYQASAVGVTGGNQVPSAPTIQFGKAKADGSGFALSYLTQPTLDPVLVTSYDTTPQIIFLPVDSGLIDDEWKVLEGVRVYCENPTAGTVGVAYAIDNDIYTQTYTDLGTPQGSLTTNQIFLPSGGLPTWRQIMFKVTITPSASTSTPVVRTLMMRYKQRESQRKSWTMQLFLEENQMTSHRSRENRTTKLMLADLNAARKTHQLVKFKDLVGDEYMVYVESVGESLKTYRSAGNNVTMSAKVILVEPAELT